jgi:hypothetical protein
MTTMRKLQIEMTDNEVATLTAICSVIVSVIRTTLTATGVPVSPAVAKALQESVATSITDQFIAGQLPLHKFDLN